METGPDTTGSMVGESKLSAQSTRVLTKAVCEKGKEQKQT